MAGSTGLASNENLRQELDEMRRKNRLLQEEVKRSRHQPEKPYEQQARDAVSVKTVQKQYTIIQPCLFGLLFTKFA